MDQRNQTIEEELGVMIVEGQRLEVSVTSEPDEDGTWHNALVFRRDSKLGGGEVHRAGVSWHVPPGIALNRAKELGEKEQMELYKRAIRPRPPLLY